MKNEDDYPAEKMARLLAISIDDYNELRHSGLKPTLKESGAISDYTLQVSANNNAKLLEKLDIDSGNTIRFTPEYVNKIMKKK